MIEEIQQSLVDFYEPGIHMLAREMGLAPEVLEEKINVNNRQHHLTYAETILLQYITGQYQLLAFEASNLGFLLLERKYKENIPAQFKKYFHATYEPEISLLKELPEIPWSMLPE